MTTRRTVLAAALFGLGFTCLAGGEQALPGWGRRGIVDYPSGNLQLNEKWDPAVGLHFRVVSTNLSYGVTIDLTRDGCRVAATDDGVPVLYLEESLRATPSSLPIDASASLPVCLKVRPSRWGIYADGRPVVTFRQPFPVPAVLMAPTNQLPPADAAAVRFQKASDARFDDEFLPPQQASEVLQDWNMELGEWKLHTAYDASVERATVARGAPRVPEAERSPNFCTVIGAGHPAMLTAGYAFQDRYTVGTAVQVSPGEMGVVAYAASTQSFYAFTLTYDPACPEGMLSLWRSTPAAPGGRVELARAATPITGGQWEHLTLKAFDAHVQCFMDGVRVFDLPVELPCGGLFGLYADSTEGIRFDDFSAHANEDLLLRGTTDFRTRTLAEQGMFLPRGKVTDLMPAGSDGCRLSLKAADEPRTLALGLPAAQPHVFAATFELPPGGGCVGLLAGFVSGTQPYYRYSYLRTRTNETFRLERVEGTNAPAVLETLTLPAAADAVFPRARLMCDATEVGNDVAAPELRLYRDDMLVLVHNPSGPVGAGSGLYVGARTEVDITDVVHTAEREHLYRDRFEKNRIYVEDPFMRHWSSPEGQWITYPDGTTWHKGDFFGRFIMQMPFVPGSEVHLAVGEEGNVGTRILTASATQLVLNAEAPIAAVAVDRLALGGDAQRWYTIHYEDHWLWVTSGKELLLKHALAAPFGGTRVRIAGFTTEQLKRSYVERADVKDWLFEASPHEWSENGGKWDVVNRFLCDPRWSNMDGESGDTIAALWSKFNFTGDFCVEFYAGLRHGWYERCGDLNLSIMGTKASPSQGYTITCTGWDPDHSQRLSRFYRNGVVVAESDKYLVPRTREGNVRRGYVPLLVGTGTSRSVHGAWYYMKFRRIGHKMEYYFDNELVFSYNDKDPIPHGRFGIWTFMNSMVVARVKVAAQDVAPTPLALRQLDPGQAVSPPALPSAPYAPRNGNRPVDLIAPAYWQVGADTVGHSRMTWVLTPDNTYAFTVTNVLGAGTFPADCTLPPVPYETLAGWRFQVKCTPGARFNFHYSVGRMNGDTFSPVQHYIHHLSGTELAQAGYTQAGATDVSGASATLLNAATTDAWTTVYAWLPAHIAAAGGNTDGLMVRLDGFGNRQPSYVLQGLTGNAPGEAYAVRGLTEIRYGRPAVAHAAGDAPAPSAWAIVDPAAGKPVVTATNLAPVQAWLDGQTVPGLVETVLEAGSGKDATRQRLAWLNPTPEPQLECAWSKTCRDAIELTLKTPYPDRRFAGATIDIAGQAPVEIRRGEATRVCFIPRVDALTDGKSPTVTLTVKAGEFTKAFTLPLADNPHGAPPALVAFTGPVAFFDNFEDRKLEPPLEVTALTRLRPDDPRQGAYLEVANGGAAHRLKYGVDQTFTLSGHPIMQFRYRGEPMTQVSLQVGYHAIVKLSESHSTAKTVRLGEPLVLDGAWHTWRGIVPDAVAGSTLSKYWFYTKRFGMASLDSVDQTGLYSTLDLDDIVFGAAVSTAEQLAFTADYFDLNGAPQVGWAVRAGAPAYDELSKEDAAAVAWTTVTNRTRCVPKLDGLADGPCHLFVRATGADGAVADVTDIPFLLDRRVDTVTHAFAATKDPELNGSLLNLAIDTAGGAPLDLDAMALNWAGKPVAVTTFGSTYTHTLDGEVFKLNWPYLLRTQLDATTNHQPAALVVAGIRDGAGNAVADQTVPIMIDYATDKTPPTLLPATYPSNVLWCADWEERSYIVRGAANARRFKATEEHKVELLTPAGEEPYFTTKTLKERSDIWQDFEKPGWCIKDYPYLYFRIRRPDMKPDDSTSIYLLLEFENDKKVAIYLTPRKDGKDEPALPEPIDWKPNVWHTVALNLADYLEKRKLVDTLASARVSTVRFSVRHAPDGHVLHIQHVYALAPWGPRDTVTLNAYDCSGVAGAQWCAATHAGEIPTNAAWQAVGGMTLTPAAMKLPTDSPWIVGRVLDKAGNISVPVRLPLIPPVPQAAPPPDPAPVAPPPAPAVVAPAVPAPPPAPAPKVAPPPTVAPTIKVPEPAKAPPAEAPKPAAEAPKPAAEAPKPAAEAPKPAAEAPKPAAAPPKAAG